MDRAEFEKLAIDELDALYRFARFLTHDATKADELVQNVYARAFRPESIEGFTPRGGGMRPWLMTIARTMFYGGLEHDRADTRAMERLARRRADELQAIEAPEAERIGGIDWSKAAPGLSSALNSLSVELRDVLWLWAAEGLKYREIAETLEIPIGTVMSRLHRARSQTARALMADETVAKELVDAGVIETPKNKTIGVVSARGRNKS